jgi:hypothetical protein
MPVVVIAEEDVTRDHDVVADLHLTGRKDLQAVRGPYAVPNDNAPIESLG